MNFTIALCLVYMLAILTAVIVQLVKSSRKERLKHIKNFKRGKFVLIYFAIAPLYFLAYQYNGINIEGSIWNTLKSSIEIVVLKYDYSTVAPLMASNLLYRITVEVAFTLIALNALMFTVSLGGQIFFNAISLWITRKFSKKVVVIVGYNPNSIDILKSVKKEHGKAIIMGNMSPQLRDDASIYRANCINLSNDDNLGEKIIRLFSRFDNKKVSVILNCENDAVSLLYVKQLCTMIENKNLTELPLTKDCGLQVYVFGSKANEATFTHYVESSKGIIKFVNRHLQIAMDFVDSYPLTQFMTAEQIDYKTATIKNEVDLNVFMIGFGKLNETIFLTSVSNNQFLTIKENKLQPKNVKYHIYDRRYPEGKITQESESVHSRSLHHGYMRYVDFLKHNKANQNSYLEFPPLPADVQIHPYEISHPQFYESLRAELANKSSYSYVIVSFGSDMENIELAEKLQQKFKEWDISPFIKIFVKVRDEKLVKEIQNDFENDVLKIFGTNRTCVYNVSKILNEKMEFMAKLRHLLYIAEDEQKNNNQNKVSLSEKNIEEKAREKWYFKYKQFQRESNIYACLSIRLKLQLLGYDYSTDGEDIAKSFEILYEAGDNRTPSTLTIDGKTIWSYCNAEQGRKSLRWTYAVLEHQRWNANMICNGIIPSNKEEIKKNGGRVLEKRLHGNITTMEGLVEYRELVAYATGASIEETDVIRYDYQIMDDMVWLLHRCGYKIIKKQL